MLILEAERPGGNIVPEGRQDQVQAEALLSVLESSFIDATIAYDLREQCFERIKVSDEKRKENKARWRAAISEANFTMPAVAANRTGHPDKEVARNHAAAWDKAMPKMRDFDLSYQLKLSELALHSRSFAYALDTFLKVLRELEKLPDVPHGVSDAEKHLNARFPNIKAYRDSAHHVYDRIRGKKGQHKKQDIQLQPIFTGSLKAPNGAIVLDLMDRFGIGSTDENGQFARVEISIDCLHFLRDVLHTAYAGFKWTGLPRSIPE